MTHEDAGHYAAKHPKGTVCDPQIAEALQREVSDGKIPCAVIHKISKKMNKLPGEVAKNADLLEIRLCKCQLGLFGYGKQKKIVRPAKKISKALEIKIRESIIDGRISCAACWDAAEKLGCSKLDVSGACETLKIKISPCQLGAF